MPMVQNLESLHQELMDIARESKKLSHTKYSSDDIEKLQKRLVSIDSQYNQGSFEGANYEEEGQAQIADELAKVHKTLHNMLARID